MDNRNGAVNALFDTGSFYTIIREDCMPPKAYFYPQSNELGTASHGGKLKISGATILIIEHEGRKIKTQVLVSPTLKQDMIIGAEAMQSWHINVLNTKKETKVIFNLDMRDPDINEVD